MEDQILTFHHHDGTKEIVGVFKTQKGYRAVFYDEGNPLSTKEYNDKFSLFSSIGKRTLNSCLVEKRFI